MVLHFDFGHSLGPTKHFWVFSPVKTACDASVLKQKLIFIDLESLTIVTTNFDEYK